MRISYHCIIEIHNLSTTHTYKIKYWTPVQSNHIRFTTCNTYINKCAIVLTVGFCNIQGFIHHLCEPLIIGEIAVKHTGEPGNQIHTFSLGDCGNVQITHWCRGYGLLGSVSDH